MGALIDVICSAKNAGAGFSATIDSVLNQTFSDFRLVIIDDGSDDVLTGRVAANAATRDERVVVRRNETSVGLTENLVRAVEDSHAEFIARIDAGDRWAPRKLELQLEAMRRDVDLVVLGTQCEYVAPDGTSLGRSHFAEDDAGLRRTFFTGAGIFTHPSILFRRLLNYRREFRYSQDLDLYLRASGLGQLACLNEPLTLCLVDPKGLTLGRKYLQRKYQRLAYASYFSRLRTGRDVELKVESSRFEEALWHMAMPFYRRYIEARTKKKAVLVWGGWLAVTFLLFPPMLGDYLRRLWLSLARA